MKIALLALASVTALANAQGTISQWDLFGQPGDVPSVPHRRAQRGRERPQGVGRSDGKAGRTPQDARDRQPDRLPRRRYRGRDRYARGA